MISGNAYFFMLSSTSFLCAHLKGANWRHVISISLIFTNSHVYPPILFLLRRTAWSHPLPTFPSTEFSSHRFVEIIIFLSSRLLLVSILFMVSFNRWKFSSNWISQSFLLRFVCQKKKKQGCSVSYFFLNHYKKFSFTSSNSIVLTFYIQNLNTPRTSFCVL